MTGERDPSERLNELMDVVVGIASNDFDRRATVGDGGDVLDGIAAGLNMLAEEVGLHRELESQYRERARRAEQLAAVGQLAASVAHEVNNPASYVLASLDLIGMFLEGLHSARSGGPDDLARAAEALTDARHGVERIVSIVRDLKRLSRREAPQLVALSLNEVVEQVHRFVRPQVAHRARFELSLGRIPPILGDRARLAQVVTNLVVNAAEAILDGGLATHFVRVETTAEEGAVQLRVRDNGGGIADGIRARIFEPFFTTNAHVAGTGLGLPISLAIVRDHGGALTFESEVGQGTTFTVTLPAAPTSALAPSRPPPMASPKMGRRPRVLFIDDEPLMLRAYDRIFGRDYDVGVALGARTAQSVLATDVDWELVLCDLMMPDLDGPAFSAWLTTRVPALADRLWFCTGGAFTPRIEEFVERNQHRCLSKPFGPEELARALSSCGIEARRLR